MEQQWHDILLHNDTGDAALHKGAPHLVEALQVISAVHAIPSATRLGLHLRDAQQTSAADTAGSTYTEKHVYQEHAEHIAIAQPLLRELRNFFTHYRPAPRQDSPHGESNEEHAYYHQQQQDEEAEDDVTDSAAAAVAVPELDGLLVPTRWAASLCQSNNDTHEDREEDEKGKTAHTFEPQASLALLRDHALFSYSTFVQHMDRLSRLVSLGETFSACEPRVKVLQSRFSLYRAFNGAREDEYHPTFGGGDIKRAPKCDLRRLETCVSAAAVVNFIESLRRDRPDYPLYAEEQIEEDVLTMMATAGQGGEHKPATGGQHGGSSRSPSRVNISVQEAVRRFFGTDVTQAERVITEEGLCLRPSYAADSTDHWLSLRRLADSGSSPRAALAGRLLQPILSTRGGADGRGELLADLIRPLIQRVFQTGSPYDRLELELTVTGADAEELPRLARWCVRSGLLESCPGVFFRLLIVQDAYMKPAAAATSGAAHFADVLQNVFGPIWEAYRAAATHAAGKEEERAQKQTTTAHAERNDAKAASTDMQALLARTCGFSVSLTHAAAVQEMPALGDPDHQFPLPTAACPPSSASAAPPDAFFVYHVWRNVQLLNAFLLAAGPKVMTKEPEKKYEDRNAGRINTEAAAAATAATTTTKPAAAAGAWNSRAAFTFTLHGGANSRTLFGESVLGLLLADSVVNPSLVFEWSPLTYLYMLTQRHVILTPSRNRCSNAAVKAALDGTAIPLAVQAGLHVSVATLDPLFYDTTADALTEELMELTKQRGLANADVTEMCLRALEASSGCYAAAERRHLFGYAWPHARARFNQFAATQVSSLRLHQRACALEHELDLIFRAASPAQQPESATRVVLFLPPTTAALLDPATAYRRSANGSARTLQREHDPALLQSLSGYHAHESLIHYPRILISGPDRAGPSEAAKRLMHAMATREAYQKFVIHPDAASAGKRRKKSATSASGSEAEKNIGPAPVWQDGVLDIKEWGEWPVSGERGTAGTAAGCCPATNAAAAAGTAASSVVVRGPPPLPMPTWSQFQKDTRTLRTMASADPTVGKYAIKRLDMLESKYKLHVALTNDDEEKYAITVPAAADDGAAGREPDVKTLSNVLTATRAVATPNNDDAAAAAAALEKQKRCVVQPIRGDAHNCVKVDVHCHMASGVTAKSLLEFMRRKIRDHPDDVVGVDDKTGRSITLAKFFAGVLSQDNDGKNRNQHTAVASTRRRTEQAEHYDEAEAAASAADLTRFLSELSIAALQVHAGNATFHRFDRFNHRFSPMGMSSLRSLFLKTENFMQGRYFAELIRGTFAQNEAEGGTFTENRLSIYGRTANEWDRLSRWFVLHGMSHRTNRWMVQVPRLFHLYQQSGQLRSFQDMLSNIFEPLWAASRFPERHPYLHFFLCQVSGFDSVDNESDREPDQTIDVTPAQWTFAENPPFAYYMFYMWSNITTLNRYRAARGFNTFQFRPHAGESGDPDHMADVFFLADGIGHGINLSKRPVLQYLYYLAQIPLAIVPMSNNALFCRYKDHPLPQFFRRGLNVAIGTDGALIFHRTEQPLLEEYGTAEALWNLSAADICELAASSVRGSGFRAARKREWLGPLYALRSVAGNDTAKSHVPQTRCAFRYEAYMEEVAYLQSRASCEMACRAMLTPLEEDLMIMDTLGISREELLRRRWAGEPITGARATAVSSSASESRLTKTYDDSKL